MDKGRRFENDQGKRRKLGISVFSPVSWNPKQNAGSSSENKSRDIRTDFLNVKISP